MSFFDFQKDMVYDMVWIGTLHPTRSYHCPNPGPRSIPNQIKTQKNISKPLKLDDGWPESVEEQSLLLLVWRHYIKDVL